MRFNMSAHFKTIATFVAGLGLVMAVGTSPAAAQGGKKAATTEMTTKTTARCNDNSWSSAKTQQGACAKHGGVAKWFGKAPKGATARCKDGEYWTAADRQGTCSGHDGVAYWMGKNKK